MASAIAGRPAVFIVRGGSCPSLCLAYRAKRGAAIPIRQAKPNAVGPCAAREADSLLPFRATVWACTDQGPIPHNRHQPSCGPSSTTAFAAMEHKRQLQHPIQPLTHSPDVEALATIGMRIRKSVADGYNRGSGVPVSRTPLPAHMSQPPALTNIGSTVDLGSNLLLWEGFSLPPVVIPQAASTKRKLDDYDDGYGENDDDRPLSLEDYTARHGGLSFNENF